MSFLSAAFFSWVQSAPFYADVHSEALTLLPSGEGKTWMDVGCGPGLVARLACHRGYDVLGIDRDPQMIRFARRNAREERRCRFEVGDLNGLSGRQSADVVSAASLLFAVPDPQAAIRQLWDCVRPGGSLLVIETTEKMTPEGARRFSRTTPLGRHPALALWARARRGRSVAASVFDLPAAHSRVCTPLMGGLVQAWIFRKEPLAGPVR